MQVQTNFYYMLSPKLFTRVSVLSQTVSVQSSKPLSLQCATLGAQVGSSSLLTWNGTELKPWVALHVAATALCKVSFLTKTIFPSTELFCLWTAVAQQMFQLLDELSHERTLWKLTCLWKKTYNQYFICKGARVGHDVIHVMCYVNKDFSTKMKFFTLTNM